MPKQEPDLQIGKDQITGFSYSFSKTLTEFLREKVNNSEVVDGSFQPEVTSAIEWLKDQLQCPMDPIDNAFELTALVVQAEKFLAIFEGRQKEQEKQLRKELGGKGDSLWCRVFDIISRCDDNISATNGVTIMILLDFANEK